MASPHQAAAIRVFEIESKAVSGLAERISNDFDDSINTILAMKGRLVVCGMGKSGIIGRKISATLASTGTPSFFMHPSEAYHGDLGMITSDDVFLAISYSGETDELIKLIPFLKENGNLLLAMSGSVNSTLALSADGVLNIGVKEEACPLQLAPTASTTATLAMGDALAVVLMNARGFQPEQFARFHPGGSLGRRLLSRVEHEMATDNLPFVCPTAKILEVIEAMSKGLLGIAIVKHPAGYGIISDGDIRRAIESYASDVFEKAASELMTINPASVTVGTREEDALKLMDAKRITALLVSDGSGIVGVFKK